MLRQIEFSKDENPHARKQSIRQMCKLLNDGISKDDMILFQDRIFEMTYDADSEVRLLAVSELCPCRVKNNIDTLWKRVFELVHDENPLIRSRVLHIICDGSPSEYETQVMESLDILHKDKDKEVRKVANRVMASIKATGKWNIL
jgi:hypothetical protein